MNALIFSVVITVGMSLFVGVSWLISIHGKKSSTRPQFPSYDDYRALRLVLRDAVPSFVEAEEVTPAVVIEDPTFARELLRRAQA